MNGNLVDSLKLPSDFPTHRHPAAFWEMLGRVIATFGFLEETLGKAIFALTATREYADDERQKAFEDWLPVLERALVNPLSNLIDEYCKAVRDHQSGEFEGFADLKKDLHDATLIRNVLCHGSWRVPDAEGRSVPLFVHKTKGRFQEPVDVKFLEQTQYAVKELVIAVINSVTRLGVQFPGSNGRGKPILPS